MSWVLSSTTACATTAGCQGCARGRGSRAGGGDVHRADRGHDGVGVDDDTAIAALGLVFTTELGRPVDPRNLLRVIEVAAEAAGVEHVGLQTLGISGGRLARIRCAPQGRGRPARAQPHQGVGTIQAHIKG